MAGVDPTETLRTLEAELARAGELAAQATSPEELERVESSVLGRKAPFSEIQRQLGSLPEADRPRVGQRVHETRLALRALLDFRRQEMRAEREAALVATDGVDLSLPGRAPRRGSIHPVAALEARIVEVFTRMGYRVVEGPEVETDWYNFQALNIPPDHPARSETDTIFLDVPGRSDLLLRTETSAMQIRTMERQDPPVYIVAPGRVYRQDTPDPSHMPVFHQVEGLAVDEGISMADLKGTLAEFARAMFGPGSRTRFIPDYFPFVEPGVEMAVSCFACGGSGCRTCKGEGWLELLGAGMVHPNVLTNVGYDAERFTGFAFGMGIERVAMAAFGVPDLRLFYENDVRFLEQFEAVGEP
jgi:phenylalanyl-tRNA synthetase alpha chain